MNDLTILFDIVNEIFNHSINIIADHLFNIYNITIK